VTPKRAEDREAGRAAVIELCARFKESIDYYTSPEFDELSTRQRFIDPFFAALGWDVTDEQKRGPLADVVLEVSMRGRHQQSRVTADEEAEDARVAEALAAVKDPGPVGVRRPDYSFRVGGRTRFLVEAKRPSVEINSPRPIYQVKTYGWNADIPVALLTDFEDLLAFDCRYQPVLAEPQTGLIPEFSLNHHTYAKNWDLLWDTFSREAVASGSLTRFQRVKVEKGQLPVDVVFLADLARWRQALARDLAKNNTSLDVWQLNECTQLTLDRLVFIRVCEDRGLEAEEHLRAVLGKKDPYPAFIKVLAPLRANYNGGLLDPDLADTLTVTPEVFKNIVRGLYTPWSPYRFDAIGVEILGSIYERALGSILTLGPDRSVKVEPKPEVRKAGGVYYTPQWVVDEIVRSTIDPLIYRKRPAQLQNFRILDPACGSGSFLLCAYGRLIHHFEEYYTNNPTVDRRMHFADDQGVERLTAAAKARLLRNSIFGVDVDPAAVEVTTMSLYLKSLEGGSPEMLRGQMQLTGAVLPSLVANIRCGNSLVSTDFYQQEQLGQLDAFEQHRLNPFKWDDDQEGFGKVLADGGFDVVIGNPPYFSVDAQYGVGHPIPAYLKNAYSEVWLDKTDIYYYFLRKAIRLAQRRLGFIVSRAFLEAGKAKRIRGWLAANARLERIEDFDGFVVFADAGISTAIVVFDTTQPHGEQQVEVRRLPSGRYATAEVIEGVRNDTAPFEAFDPKVKLGERPWHFHNPYATALFSRIDGHGDPLIQVCELGQGMQTGANGVFGKLDAADVVDYDLPPELLKRRARNSHIDRFCIADSGEFVLYLEDVPSFRSLPKQVQNYLRLRANENKLRGRAAFKRGNCEWWQYTWPLHKDLYAQPRLVCPYRTGHLRFALDESFSWLTLTDTTVAFKRAGVQEDIRYLLGLLNTRLLTYRFRGLAKLTGPDMWEAFDNSIRDLPIRRINFEDATQRRTHDTIVRLVKEVEKATVEAEIALSASDRSVAVRRARALSDQLDEIALDLYGIRDEQERENVLALGATWS
jgi:type I restriction-modification system DNA methylase subunit